MQAHRIDTQHHILPPRYLAEVRRRRRRPARWYQARAPDWSPEQSLAAMDRHSVATAVVSMSAPGFAGPDPVGLCRHCNDYAAAIGAGLSGAVRQLRGAAAARTSRRAWRSCAALSTISAPTASACSRATTAATSAPPLFAPVLDELDRRGTVVYVHPAEPPESRLVGLPPASLEFPFDTTRAIASLLFTGSFARTRGIHYIFSHAGGALPALAERLARARAAARPEAARPGRRLG